MGGTRTVSDGIIGCVSAGIGITMLPRSIVERSARRNEVRIHALPREISLVATSFVTHKAQVMSSALERLIEIIVALRRRNVRKRKGRGQ
jgi:DNA-binding transcriptional LysR family regulator